MLLCQSFWAYPLPANLTNVNQTHICAWGYEPYNSNMARDNSDLTCVYNFTIQSQIYNYTTNITRTANCGPNSDNSFYCPKYRSEDVINLISQGLWNADYGQNCSLSTSI